jgi:hypothetical protein
LLPANVNSLLQVCDAIVKMDVDRAHLLEHVGRGFVTSLAAVEAAACTNILRTNHMRHILSILG